jgi:chemotaxis protein methyltransferase CheR
MKDQECVHFLQWALPQLRMRWPGFRKVRRQVCNRIHRRVQELDLSGLAAYQSLLETDPSEWPVLDSLCRITISSFFRDKGVFDFLESHVLPELAEGVLSQGSHEVRCWSAGCASGEEAYSLKLLWRLTVSSQFPGVEMEITGTDTDPGLIRRAQTACYRESSLKKLPEAWQREAFICSVNGYCLRVEFKRHVQFIRQDIRSEIPNGQYHLILCRNLAFTYFDDSLQREVLQRLCSCLVPKGFLVIGTHENLPSGIIGASFTPRIPGIYQSL